MTDFLLRQMRHGIWANEQLLGRCRALADEQLELTVPGTYGSIRKTLAHIVAAEEGYLVRLLGSLLHEPPLREKDLTTLDGLLVPAPDEWFEAYEVSARVSKPENNDADLLQRVA